MSKKKPNCRHGCDDEGWIFRIVDGRSTWVPCPDPVCSGVRDTELEAQGQEALPL